MAPKETWDDSFLSARPSEDEILEALELWEMPKDAYPPPGNSDCKYKLYCKLMLYCKDSEVPHEHPISVCLRRQCFVSRIVYWTRQIPYPMEMDYFSFWSSPTFGIGPVQNPWTYGECPERGYNHNSASLAFGEARILAGWCSKGFVVDWACQFKEHSQHSQKFTPIVIDHILWRWPDIDVSHFGVTDQHWPVPSDEPEDVGEEPDADPILFCGLVPQESEYTGEGFGPAPCVVEPGVHPGSDGDTGEEFRPRWVPHVPRCGICLRDLDHDDAGWVDGFCPDCLANPHRDVRRTFW
jgi:hypothetical protein